MSNKDEVTTEGEGRDESIGAPEPTDELSLLKQRADLMGIKYGPNIGIDKLRAKIEEKRSQEPMAPTAPGHDDEELESIEAYERIAGEETFTPGTRETAGQINMRRRQEALRLVRVRVTNMNPLKSALKGEIFSVGNSQIGFVKKYVPYNAENGWHVPQIILTHLQNKKFMSHYTVKIGNKQVKRHKLIPELAIEILPPLTDAEMQELKQRQAMNAGAQDPR